MKKKARISSLAQVVKQHLCTQCGTCVAVCPNEAIEMLESPAGGLFPSIRAALCCNCGKCLAVCPGWNLDLAVFEGIDPFTGIIQGAWCGRSADETLWRMGQSGALSSALLAYLLDEKLISGALLTAMPEDGSLKPRSVLARSIKEIIAAQGSKYCPIALNSALKAEWKNERIAQVGLPCHFHGIHKLDAINSELTSGIVFRIGLFCDRTQFFSCMDQMILDAGLKRSEVRSIHFRSKVRKGWPGEVRYILDKDRDAFSPSKHRIGLKEYFTPPRCRICFDKSNLLSDITLGDAWGIDHPKGYESVILARTGKGLKLIEKAQARGYLKLKEIDPQTVFSGQRIENRKLNFYAFSEIWRETGTLEPELPFLFLQPQPETPPEIKKELRNKLEFNLIIARSKKRSRVLFLVRQRRFLRKVKTIFSVSPQLLIKRIIARVFAKK